MLTAEQLDSFSLDQLIAERDDREELLSSRRSWIDSWVLQQEIYQLRDRIRLMILLTLKLEGKWTQRREEK